MADDDAKSVLMSRNEIWANHDDTLTMVWTIWPWPDADGNQGPPTERRIVVPGDQLGNVGNVFGGVNTLDEVVGAIVERGGVESPTEVPDDGR